MLRGFAIALDQVSSVENHLDLLLIQERYAPNQLVVRITAAVRAGLVTDYSNSQVSAGNRRAPTDGGKEKDGDGKCEDLSS